MVLPSAVGPRQGSDTVASPSPAMLFYAPWLNEYETFEDEGTTSPPKPRRCTAPCCEPAGSPTFLFYAPPTSFEEGDQESDAEVLPKILDSRLANPGLKTCASARAPPLPCLAPGFRRPPRLAPLAPPTPKAVEEAECTPTDAPLAMRRRATLRPIQRRNALVTFTSHSAPEFSSTPTSPPCPSPPEMTQERTPGSRHRYPVAFRNFLRFLNQTLPSGVADAAGPPLVDFLSTSLPAP